MHVVLEITQGAQVKLMHQRCHSREIFIAGDQGAAQYEEPGCRRFGQELHIRWQASLPTLRGDGVVPCAIARGAGADIGEVVGIKGGQLQAVIARLAGSRNISNLGNADDQRLFVNVRPGG
jgi:hypothetical protein